MSSPRVSVIITTVNEEEFIGDAIDSILQQTLDDFELIIVDGGSDDRTQEIISAYDDDRIELITETELGRSASLNRAIREADGEYVANVDPDDISHPTRLEKQSQFLDGHPQVGVVGVAHTVKDGIRDEEYERYYPTSDDDIRREMTKGIPIPHSGMMARREALLEAGLYDESLDDIEDLELWSRIGTKYEFANIDQILLERDIRKESTWHSRSITLVRNIKLAKIGFKIARSFDLPLRYYAYPLLRVLYTFLPSTGKRYIRRWFSRFKERDLSSK